MFLNHQPKNSSRDPILDPNEADGIPKISNLPADKSNSEEKSYKALKKGFLNRKMPYYFIIYIAHLINIVYTVCSVPLQVYSY